MQKENSGMAATSELSTNELNDQENPNPPQCHACASHAADCRSTAQQSFKAAREKHNRLSGQCEADNSSQKETMQMKTIKLTDNDVLELRLLAAKISRQHQNLRQKNSNEKYTERGAVACPSAITTDEELEARHGQEVLETILKQCK